MDLLPKTKSNAGQYKPEEHGKGKGNSAGVPGETKKAMLSMSNGTDEAKRDKSGSLIATF